MMRLPGSDTNGLLTRRNLPVAGLVLVLHLVFLVLALLRGSYLTDDSIQYLTLAENLSQSGVFSQSYFPPLVPDLQRTPGYPVFLLLLGRNPVWVLLVQHGLVLLTGWMLFRSLRERVSLQAARWGTWVWLLQPYPVLMASLVLSESLFLCLLLAGAAWALRFFRSGHWKWALGTGLALGLAVLVRPSGLPVLWITLVAMLVQLILRVAKKVDWGAQMVGLGALVAVLLLLLGPWMLRNERIGGRMELSSMGEMGMLYGRLGGLAAHQQGLGNGDHALIMSGDSLAATVVGFGEVRKYYSVKKGHEWELHPKEVNGLTLGYFMDHPGDAVVFQGKNLLRMASGLGHGWALQVTGSNWLALVSSLLQGLLTLGVGIGFVLSLLQLRNWRMEQWYLLAAVAGLVLVSAAAWADGRYRIPIELLLCLLGWPLGKFSRNHQTKSRGSV